MSALDWLVILAYLAVMLYIGYHSMKTVKTDEDFVLAGRNVGNIYIILSLFASFTGLSGLFGTPQYVYEYGIAGWWWWATFPIGVFIMGMTMAKLLRRRMHVTLPDVVDVNHSSKAVRVAASLVTVWNYLAWTAGQVAGIVLVITTFTDRNGTAAVIVAYIIIVLFTLLGGFRAVVYTDSLQAVLFLVVLGLVIPAVLLLHYDVPEALAQTTSIDGFYKLFGSVPAGTMITWWLLAPAGFIDNMALQRVFAAKDEKYHCRFPADDYLWPDPYVHRYYGQIYFACRLRSCQRYAQSFPAGPAQGDAGFAGGRLCRGGCFHRQFYPSGMFLHPGAGCLLRPAKHRKGKAGLFFTGQPAVCGAGRTDRPGTGSESTQCHPDPDVWLFRLCPRSASARHRRFFPLEAFRPRHVAHHCLRRTHRCHSHSDGGTFPRLPGRPDRLRHSFLHRTLERQAAGGSPLTTPVVPISR